MSVIWPIRAMGMFAAGIDPRDEVRTDGRERTFWPQVRGRFNLNTVEDVLVTDSHADAYHAAKAWGIDNVVSFDAHADLGYHGLADLQLSGDEDPTCEDWLGRLVLEGVRATVIYPAHSLEQPIAIEKFAEIRETGRVQLTLGSDFLGSRCHKGIPVTVLHLCRSGAWTPPWLDERFLMLAMGSGVKVEPSVYVTKRSLPDWRALEQAGNEQRKMFDELRNKTNKGGWLK